MMRTGRVDWFNRAKGFGFIQPADGGPDVFVHGSVLLAAGVYEAREGDAVEFLERVGRGSGKPQASFVRLLTGDEAAAVPRLYPRPPRAR
jgi:CspA family cold shock protein